MALDLQMFGAVPQEPAARAQFVALGATLGADDAEAIADLLDASDFGEKRKYFRYAMGGAIGLAVGGLLGFALARR